MQLKFMAGLKSPKNPTSLSEPGRDGPIEPCTYIAPIITMTIIDAAKSLKARDIFIDPGSFYSPFRSTVTGFEKKSERSVLLK